MLEDIIGRLDSSFLAKDDPTQAFEHLSEPAPQDDKRYYEFGQLGLLMHRRLPLCATHEREIQKALSTLRA